MTSRTITANLRDSIDRARRLIQRGLALGPEARSEPLARLIARSLHGGIGTALCLVAAKGKLRREVALKEIGALIDPLDDELRANALGHHLLLTRGGRS